MAGSSSVRENDLDGRVELEDGIKLSDLLGSKDITFSVKNPIDVNADNAGFEGPEDVFEPETLLQNVNLETIESDDIHKMPFEAIKARMKNVTPTGTVMKRVLREGIGETIPPEAVVRIHYDGFFEFNEVPFDSTTLRGKSVEFLLGSGFLPGLDIAVATMRKNERAEFMLLPSVAYGKLGCPPRIPPNVEVLFIVEVMSWRAGAEAAVSRALSDEGKVSFEVSRDAFKALMREGIELYEKNQYKESKFKLERAKNMITECHTKDEGQDQDRNKLVFKVCLNLAMVYNKLPDKSAAPNAVLNCRKAVEFDSTNGKAHLQWGIALTTLGEYSKAKEHIMKAKKKLGPDDPSVNKALERLEEKKKLDTEGGKAFWSKALNLPSQPQKAEEKSPEAEQILKQLEQFCNDPEREIMILPAGLTHVEKDVLLSSAERLNLNVVLRDKSISITKYS